jgi:hypothetical protein
LLRLLKKTKAQATHAGLVLSKQLLNCFKLLL